YDEPLLRQMRTGMQAAGIPVESSKGEAWPGQQEINFRYGDALTTADRHVIYKNGAKEIAHLNGCSITFMAKPDHTWIGNSCHLHASLWRDGENAFAGDGGVFDWFLAGWIACTRPLALDGSAVESASVQSPASLREVIQAFDCRSIGRAALGNVVLVHYLDYARSGQRLFDQVVTCYGRERLFARR